MTTDYNAIAAEYKRAKLQPWRRCIESFTLMSLVGDLAGPSNPGRGREDERFVPQVHPPSLSQDSTTCVVDLACGEGFYTRLLRQHGASRALGVDLSPRMIELAKAQEEASPLGIEYQVGDARSLALSQKYDLAVAAYLLNYAHDRTELEAMCRGVAGCLKPGGRFVAVNTNPGLDFRSAPCYRNYGFETSIGPDLREGAPITWTFFLDGGSISIENYYVDVPAHEEALRAAGFREVRWHRPQLAPQEQASGREDWERFLASPPVIFLECLM